VYGLPEGPLKGRWVHVMSPNDQGPGVDGKGLGGENPEPPPLGAGVGILLFKGSGKGNPGKILVPLFGADLILDGCIQVRVTFRDPSNIIWQVLLSDMPVLLQELMKSVEHK